MNGELIFNFNEPEDSVKVASPKTVKGNNSAMMASRELSMDKIQEMLTVSTPTDYVDTVKEQEEKSMMKEEETAQPVTYQKQDIFEDVVKYFDGDELAAGVWIDKYALKNEKGELLEKSPEQMHRRMAREFARIERKYPNPMSEELIFSLFDRFKFIIPQGSPMAGIGNNYQISSLSNCFVIGNSGNSDSYGGIMKMDEEQVQLMKRRGGVGHDLSHIRPTGSFVKNCAHTSTGVVPFMERYSNSTREVAQDGRRGALMLSISIKHPDAERFIDAKMTEGKVTGANVSLELATLPQAALADMVGYVSDGQTTADLTMTDADAPYVGVGFVHVLRYKGTKTYLPFWYYKVQFALGQRSFNTKGDSTEFQTESLEGKAVAVRLTSGGADSYYVRPLAPLATEAAAKTWLNTKAGISAQSGTP